MTNADIAKEFTYVAAILEAQGESRFRIRAYQNAVDTITNSPQNLSQLNLIQLKAIPGIGEAIAQKILDLVQTGKSPAIEKYKSQVPSGMLPLLDLEGVGPKKAYLLAKTFKLDNATKALEQLKKHAVANEIAQLEGFGDKSQQDILESIQLFQTSDTSRLRLDQADVVSLPIIDYLSRLKSIVQVSTLGSSRRRKPTIGDIDIGVATSDHQAVIDHLKKYDQVKDFIAEGDQLVRFHHQSGLSVDIKIIHPDAWGSLLQHFTGSKAHNVSLRELALKKGYSLSEHGIKTKSGTKLFSSEEKFYHFLDLDWIPPELREDRGEIQAAQTHKLPVLVDTKDIKGDFHTHTNYDWINSHDAGKDSIESMLSQAQKLGYTYFGIGDHNPSKSSYSPDQITQLIKTRSQTIHNIAKKFSSLSVFTTLEVDINPDGTLTIPDEAIDHLDFLIISVHSSFSQSQSDTTSRLLNALSRPKVKILGHPTGRLINKRESINADWSKIFTYAAKHHIALEINASPQRLDLPDTLVQQAIAKDVKLVINTDAHSVQGLNQMHYGVDAARRGWATKADIINTYSFSKLKNWINL